VASKTQTRKGGSARSASNRRRSGAATGSSTRAGGSSTTQRTSGASPAPRSGSSAGSRADRGSTGSRSGKGSTGSRAGKGAAGSRAAGSSRSGDRDGGLLATVRRDLGGLALVLAGVLAGLGIYADAAGPVGNFLEAVALGLFGLLGYVVPVALAWFGLLVMIGRPSPEIGRIAIGTLLLVVGLLAVLHLVGGAPHPEDGVRGLWSAGGLLGWAIASPSTAAVSEWGTVAVAVAVLALGLLIVTKTPFSAVAAAIRGLLAPAERPAADAPASEPAPARPRRASGADGPPPGAPDQAVDPAAAEAARARVRATLAGKSATQPPLEDALEQDGPSAGRAARRAGGAADDVEAGRVPDPPIERARVPADAVRKAAKVAPVRSWDDYELPSLDLLASGRAAGRASARTIEAQTAALQETFDQFGVDATVARHTRGPTVTRFEIELGPGVQVKKVANMGDDIAYALAAPDVRIVAPIPGKSAIGVEVPNRQRDLITLGDILRSDEAQADPHPLSVALGVDIAGAPALVNLATMPHLLVSGATGSGKSVTLNGMISSIIMRTRPDQVRLLLVDPKRVELNHYEGAPHLLSPVVTDPRRAADAVQWCVKEMEQRYELLAHLGYRNLDGYNEAVRAQEVPARSGPDGTELEPQELPYILLVIDELADLMLVAPRDVEDAICRIAQMARAVGIHMVIATQRPSVDVITGLIKANIPSRLALAVASQTDSRTIIDMNGAEKLVGKGDMLFLPASQGKPSRLQGCWVTEREITAAVAFCRAQREPEFDERVVRTGDAADRADAARSGDDGSDQALLRRAAEQVVVSGLGSTSMLQRKLRIGFARAGRLMDELEELGVVGPNEGSKAREVLWSPEQLDAATESGLL
jgi:DNA segregation ATPase FtsK/SpoIIIE, S-DNA-T family